MQLDMRCSAAISAKSRRLIMLCSHDSILLWAGLTCVLNMVSCFAG